MTRPDADQSRTEMGQRVKALRESRGLTLQALSDRSGLAISTISKIERGLMAPTYDRFSGLAKGLGVDVSELFSARGDLFEAGTVDVARSDEFAYLETENYTYEMLFTDVRGKTMTPMLGTLKPLEKMEFDRMVSHPGEEFLMVLKGTVVVQLEGREDVTLSTGHSIYFDSGRGHLYAAEGVEDARILVVCTQFPEQGAQPG
ncbi:helix-turn-helix domain-containing protein [Pseudooceanicola sp.]|uniref:helix-turn-helix domain-containing protein n=1 Tax=Pseudooceanicola sp. TaxID=1914328 RepID=UPI0035C6EAC0